MINLGTACLFLSIEICRSLFRDIHLSQKRFIKTILQQLQMENCNGVAIPIESGI
jgi:hypothetical protein